MMRREYLIYLLLAVVTLALFAPVAGYKFVNLDDPEYVTENPPVKAGLTGAGIVWAFTKTHESNWHPLTWISHMLDCQLYGLKPAGHHITNLLFHVANTLLLFGLLRSMTGAVWRSAFVAALFAWHPMHVESVAWVAERKDVLSAFFWLLTMLAYVRYANELKVQSSRFKVADSESKVQGPRSKAKLYYGLTLVCFALGLMAKPMLVTLPFVLLLMDYWPLRRNAKWNKANVTRLVLEKIPFFILAAASSVITYFAQQAGGSVATMDYMPFDYRVSHSLVSYFCYVEKMFWPKDMAAFYPLPTADWPVESVVAGGFMLAAVTIGVLVWARRKPYLAVGWFWFVGTLVPVIGLVHIGAASMADRYTYIPGIGLFIMVAWGMPELVAKWPQGQWILRTAGVAVLAACAVVTSLQLKYWKDTITLYDHAIAVTTNNIFAYFGEAGDLLAEGKTAQAMDRFQKVLAIDPHHFRANCRMAQILDDQGKTGEAVPYYREALRQQPDLPILLNNVAWILAANPDPSVRNGPEAVEYAERACKLTHYETPFYIGTLAAAYAEAGRFKEAVDAATKAYNLAMTLGMKDLAQRNEELLKLYQAGQPFREAPREQAKGVSASGGAGK